MIPSYMKNNNTDHNYYFLSTVISKVPSRVHYLTSFLLQPLMIGMISFVDKEIDVYRYGGNYHTVSSVKKRFKD